MLPYAKQSISEEDKAAVLAALDESLITRGPLVQQFEEALARYSDVDDAVVFNSASTALAAAYFAAEFSPADRVFAPANTFIATVISPLQAGVMPDWVDISRGSGNMCLDALEEKLRFQSTRSRPFVVPVHFSGIPVDMRRLDRMLVHPDTVIIEDAAHALGSYYPSGEKVGSCAYSQMTVFSFHPAKTMTTGEGGAVTTNDPQLAQRLRLYRDNGIDRSHARIGYYEVKSLTGNYNFTSFQAALGLSQLSRVDQFIAKRQELVTHYRKQLSGLPLVTLFDQPEKTVGYHLFVVQIDFESCGKTREAVMQELLARGIGTQVHYIPLYHHPAVRTKGSFSVEEVAETELYYQQALSLPLYFDLALEDVEKVCKNLSDVLQK